MRCCEPAPRMKAQPVACTACVCGMHSMRPGLRSMRTAPKHAVCCPRTIERDVAVLERLCADAVAGHNWHLQTGDSSRLLNG